MSLLTLCQTVAEECGYGVPASIVGNTDDTAIQLLALANKAGKALAKKPWQALQSEHTFSTVAGTETYVLPSDYGWYTNNTAWDATNYWQLRGSLSAADWRAYKNGVVNASPRTLFRVRRNLIYLNPIPTSVRSVTIEYISNAWCASAAAVNQSAFAADTDVTNIDEFLVMLDLTWRFLERKGVAYAEQNLEAETMIGLAMAHDVPSQPANQAQRSADVWPPLPSWSGTGLSGL